MIKSKIKINIFVFLGMIILFMLFLSEISIADVTDTLYSDEIYNKYYYEQLDEQAKYIYDAMYSNINKTLYGNTQIKIDVSEHNILIDENVSNIFQSAIDAFDRDHPEVFWIDINKIEFKYSSFTHDNSNYLNNIYICHNESYSNYYIDGYSSYDDVISDIKKVNSVIKNELPYINAFTDKKNNYNKLKYIHDYIVKHNEYNKNTVTASKKSIKCISAILGTTEGIDAPVCEGYSRAFKVLCDKAGIPCVIVSGYSTSQGKDVSHMWNYVMLDNYWYAVDVTWDDPILSTGTYDELSDEKKYAYFLIGYDILMQNHIPVNTFLIKDGYDVKFDYPELAVEKYEYKIENYKITINKTNGGKLGVNVIDLTNIIPGTVVKITIVPDENMTYRKGSLTINKKAINALTFIMPEENVEINARFDSLKSNDDNLVTDKIQQEEISTTLPQNSDTEAKETKRPSVNQIIRPSDIDKSENYINKEDDKEIKEENAIYSADNEEELDEKFDNLKVNDFEIKTNNHSSLNLCGNKIIIGSSDNSLSEDVIVSFYDTVYSDDEILSIIENKGFTTDNCELASAFSIQITGNDGQLTVIDGNGSGLGILLPLNKNCYNSKYGINFFVIKDSVAYNKIFNVVAYNSNYYIYFSTTDTVASYVITYNTDKNEKKTAVTGSTYQSSGDEITNVIKEDSKKELYTANPLILIVIILLIIIIGLNVYFLVHSGKVNRMMNKK